MSVGRVLISKDEEESKLGDELPTIIYKRFPKNIHKKKVFVVKPLLETGLPILCCLGALMTEGVKQENITFVNIISCEIGLKAIYQHYPKIKTICSHIDPYLLSDVNKTAPGIGDFEARYYGV